MSNLEFVGFQKSPKQLNPNSICSLGFSIKSNLNRGKAFALVSTPAGLSQWFTGTQSLACEPGGKVLLNNFAGESTIAVCTAVKLGHNITYVSEWFGQLKATVSAQGIGSNASNAKLDIQFEFASSKPSDFELQCRDAIARLASLVTAA